MDSNFILEVIKEDQLFELENFRCGNIYIDKYFHSKVRCDDSVCYVYRNVATHEIVGAATICCSGINIGSERLVMLKPAVKIEYLAMDVKFQDIVCSIVDCDKFYISDLFLSELVKNIRYIADNFIGAGFIILYSVPDAVHFYSRNLFAKFDEFMKAESTYELDGCVPMYMQL